MAFMAMMGADSVAYHEANVAQRADDFSGQALAYYASRGETPLRWGGSGAADLVLSGTVTSAQFHALYGPGGACDPTTGERLVNTRRPGVELVVAAHKSVAELGVIGRAEDMHRILDAERDATLSYLDRLFTQQGGRRGEVAVATRTSGLVYAHTRHATSRAGDPNPHDHVLVANVVRMGDVKGGWKAAHTALLREHLHAATMFGRMAAAHEAVRLGYAVERDDGPSGRLGHWRVVGIPEEVMAVHSKRAAEIASEMERLGYSSYRAKGVVARETRARKRLEPIGDLTARWRAEVESLGYRVEQLQRLVRDHPARRRLAAMRGAVDDRQLVGAALAPDGPLASRKVFARRDVVVAVAPSLFGRDPAELARLVNRVLADPEALPLVPTAGARGQVWATATTVATEQAVADTVARQVVRDDAPAVADDAARRAVARAEAALGSTLTSGQRDAVLAIATSGRGAELVVGVAGSGKTTALGALRDAFEAEGFEVVGTSTSGQAARTLRNAAGIEPSRTLASLTWRLDHGQLVLTRRHVVVLDEAAMTDDADLLRLLEAAWQATAKVVMVGDHRQLGSVLPGGGFEALVHRYGAAVHVLAENVRQRDPVERRALEQLRSGNVATAVATYARLGRIVVERDRAGALAATVEGWATDAAEGRDAVMYAWRRADVAQLNLLARETWRAMGRLGDEELVAHGGTAYSVGDRVVTLAPGAEGKVVTSETGTVVALGAAEQLVWVRMDDAGAVHVLAGDEIGADRLALGYAVTVHRSQGSTVQRSHVLEDGGGRELAYVKMSRATERSTVYLVADSLDQAVEDLRREWAVERRMTWAIDHTAIGRTALDRRGPDRALRRGRLLAERQAILAAPPRDPTDDIRAAQRELSDVSRRRADLEVGQGGYAGRPIHDAVRRHLAEQHEVARLERDLANPRLPRRDRKEKQPALADARERLAVTTRTLDALATPERADLDTAEDGVRTRMSALYERRAERERWIADHPEALRRLDMLNAEITALDAGLDPSVARGRDLTRDRLLDQPDRAIALSIGLSLGR